MEKFCATIKIVELPENFKKLYRHWPNHSECESAKADMSCVKNTKVFGGVLVFTKERMSVWKKRIAGSKPPFTDDPIIQKYRFCNVFREFDRQTIEYHESLNPIRHDFPLWLLNMFYSRLVARPETVKAAGLLSFDSKQNDKVYDRLMALPRPRFGTPYVFPVSTILKSKTPTRELFITKYLPKIIPAVATEIESWSRESVFHGVEKILPIFKFNLNFLWTEVLIDTAYQFPDRIDLFSQFPIGPGSKPTLEKINPDADFSILVTQLTKIPFDLGITYNGRNVSLSAENWEGVCCEFRKYTNLQMNRGRKRLFR